MLLPVPTESLPEPVELLLPALFPLPVEPLPTELPEELLLPAALLELLSVELLLELLLPAALLELLPTELLEPLLFEPFSAELPLLFPSPMMSSVTLSIPSVTSSTTLVIPSPRSSNKESSFPAVVPPFPTLPTLPDVEPFPARSSPDALLSSLLLVQAVAVHMQARASPSARSLLAPADFFPFFIVSSILLRELKIIPSPEAAQGKALHVTA